MLIHSSFVLFARRTKQEKTMKQISTDVEVQSPAKQGNHQKEVAIQSATVSYLLFFQGFLASSQQSLSPSYDALHRFFEWL